MPAPSITYRSDDVLKWGFGTGVDLDAEQIDDNFWELAQAIVALQNADPLQPDNIANVTVLGTAMTIVLQSGAKIGPLPLPVAIFRLRGEWTPDTLYNEMDLITVAGLGVFMALQDTTSPGSFDPNETTSNGDAWQMIFSLATPPTLEGLGDVDIDSSGPAQFDFLLYDIDSTGLGKWKAFTPAQVASLLGVGDSGTGGGGGGVSDFVDLGDVDWSGAVEGDVPTWDGSKLVPQAPSGGGSLDDLDDVNTAGGVDGDVLTLEGGEWVPRAPVVGDGGTISGVDNFAQLGDVDTHGLADGDAFVWDSAESKLVPRKVLLGEPGSHYGADMLAQLSDVDVSGIANGQVLVWNAGASKFEPAYMTAGSGGGADRLDQLGDVEIDSNLDDGDVLVAVLDSHGTKFRNLSMADALAYKGIFNPKGQWSTGGEYFPLDVALRNGTAWLCYSHVIAPNGASQWQAFSNPGEQATVSSDGQTATFPAVNGEQTVRSTQGRSSGLLVFEIVGTDSASGFQLGIVDNTYSAFTSNTSYPGSADSHGVSTARGGSVYYNGSGGVKSGANDGGGWNSGDRIAVAVDFTNKKIWFRDVTRDAGTPHWYGNNNTGADDPTVSATGFDITTLIGGAPVYIAVACYNAGTAVLYSIDLVGALPVGYSAWDGAGNEIPDLDGAHWLSQGSTEAFGQGDSSGGRPGPVPPPGPADPGFGFLNSSGQWEYLPLVLSLYMPGVPDNNAVARASVPYQVTFPPNFGGIAPVVPSILVYAVGGGTAQTQNNGNTGLAASTGMAGTASTATATIGVYKINPAGTKTQIGTIVFSAGNKIPTFTTQSGDYETVEQTDVIEFDFPASADATLAEVTAALIGYLA